MHIDAYEALQAGDPRSLAAVPIPPGVPVVTVCGAGKTSLTAMEHLRSRGYDARSLVGGMKAWSLAWNSAEISIPGSAARVIQVRRTGKGCLSYLVGRDGEAAVIDPALPPEVYLELAASRGWTITRVIDTHVHADHLSRARALADAIGATLYMPAQAPVTFPFAALQDGDDVSIGASRMVALRTPGHTLESTSYLLDDAALFTGDTLFLAGVGRPDLEASSEQARARAYQLHASLARFAMLPPETVILPGHTSEPVAFDRRALASTLATIKDRSTMLGMTDEAFVATILARIPPTPPNHARIVALNQAGALPEGDPTDLEAGANRCAVS